LVCLLSLYIHISLLSIYTRPGANEAEALTASSASKEKKEKKKKRKREKKNLVRKLRACIQQRLPSIVCDPRQLPYTSSLRPHTLVA
jgi:hypothetical protein